jgi:hypothetical protein
VGRESQTELRIMGSTGPNYYGGGLKLGDKTFSGGFRRNIFDFVVYSWGFENNEIIFYINSYEREESVRPTLLLHSLHSRFKICPIKVH